MGENGKAEEDFARAKGGVLSPIRRVPFHQCLVPDDEKVSAFFSSAALLKLKLPVITVCRSAA
jgi:hypothetical protein